MTDTARLVVALGLQDNLSSGLGRASAQLKGLEKSASQLGRGFGQVGRGLDLVITRGALAAAAGLGAALKVAGDFEAQMNTIGTIAVTSGQSTQAGLKDIGDGIRALARETGAPLDDLTHSYYDILSAGIKVSDAQAVLTQANQLAVGAIGTNSEAVDVLTTALNSYNLSGKDAKRVSDELAEAVAAGKTTLSQIAPVYAQVAPLAAQFGIGTDEIAASLGRLTSKGNLAPETVTQMSRAILELVKPKGPLKELQAAMGINFADEVRKKGLVGTLQEIRVAADKLGPHVFEQLFSRLEGFRFAVQVTGENNAAFVEELDKVRKSAGLTSDQFDERQQGLNFQLNVLKANLKDAGITIGTELLPVFGDLAKQLSGWLQQPGTQKGLKDFAKDLAGGIQTLKKELQGADFSGLVDGMKLAAEVSKGAFDLFNKLPPEIRALAVGALVANKVTGGGVGLIAKGLGNILGGAIGLGGGLLGRGSSPANPVWVSSAGGGVGGGIGTVAAAGGAISIGSILGITSAVGLGAILGSEIGHAVFFDPTVKPAVEFETSQFNQLVASNDPKELRRGLDAIDQGLRELGVGAPDPFGIAGVLTNFFAGDQITALKTQQQALLDRLDALPKTPRTGSRNPGTVHAFFDPMRGKADLVDPMITRLLAGRALSDTAIGRDIINPLLLPFEEQVRLTRQLVNRPSITVPITINNPIYVNASLIAAKSYQIKTSARIREG